MKNEVPTIKYTCPKCGSRKYEMKGIAIQYNLVINLHGTRYTAVTCERCRYTEFYNLPLKRIKEAFDFIPGG